MPPEPIRLVIWNLDETFWHGTLTEGGIRLGEDTIGIVRTLAARGIPSAICSKNTLAMLVTHSKQVVLFREKGPRIQLRNA